MATVERPGADDGDMPPAIVAGRAERTRRGVGSAAASRLIAGSPIGGLAARVCSAAAVERDRGTGFLFLPVLLATGAGIYWWLPVEPAWLLVSVLAAGFGCLALAVRPHRGASLAAAIGFVLALGVLAGKVETWRAGTQMLGSEISTRLTGRVVAIERQASGRVRLTIDVDATARPALRYAPDRVRISARAIPPGLEPGDGVAGHVRLFPPSGPALPGGYDFAFESYMDGIGATGFFLSAVAEVPRIADPGPAEALSAAVARMREAIAARIMERIDGPEGAVAAALIAGTRAGIPEEVNEDLRKTGLAHVLSISGLHMALVAGTVMFALRFAFALAPGFASQRPVKKYAAVAALVAAGYYLVVCGAAVAAQRSFVMIAVMLVALLFDRSAITMRNLAIAALIVVALSPHEVAGPSFQMSFAATAALIAAYAAWSQMRHGREPRGDARDRAGVARFVSGRIVAYAAGIAMTSLIAGLATALYGVWHFHRMAPLGLIANLLAMPVVSTVVMPPAVLAGVLMPFGLDGPALDLMGWGISTMLAIAHWLAERTPFDAVGAIPGTAVLALTAALVLATVLTTWLRVAALPFLAAGLVLVAGRDLPDVLVSEDGRLVAVRTDDGMLAVNRPRPNGFVTGIWLDAIMAHRAERPFTGGRDGAGAATGGGKGERFSCDGPVCTFGGGEVASVVWVGEGGDPVPHCAATVLVVEDATVSEPCPQADPALILTRRDLARSGSAVVRLGGGATGPRIDRSIREPFRPWHEHRTYGRAARGLAPWRPLERPAALETARSGTALAPPADQ